MDWWDNSQRELETIFSILQEPSPEPEPEPEPAAQVPPAPVPLATAPVASEPTKLNHNTASRKKTAPAIPCYSPAKLRETTVTAEDILLPKYAAGLRKKLETVIAKEAPVSKSLLIRRVVQSYGITRAGSRIQRHLDNIMDAMKLKTTQQGEQVFVWTADQDPESYNCYRPALTEEDRRDAREIPVQEAAAAVCQVLEDQISLNQEDLIRESAKLLGYSRLGTAVTAVFTEAVRYSAEKGRITEGINGNWTIPA
jgi:hypothetical protein